MRLLLSRRLYRLSMAGRIWKNLYLTQAWEKREGAVLRVRPKAMTVTVIIAGLLPILWGSGTGSEVMSRIAAPMVGGMVTAPLLSLFVIPAAYGLMRRRQLGNKFVHNTEDFSERL